MIIEYHRPQDLDQALTLLARVDPPTLPLGGGTILNRRLRREQQGFAVVDLQQLGLDTIRRMGNQLEVGATAHLQSLYEWEDLPEEVRSSLRESLEHELALNGRQMATVAGTMVSCTGRSPFVTALLALDAHIQWVGEREEDTSLGDYLALRPADVVQAGQGQRLMEEIHLPVNVRLVFASVARSPMDLPIVCAAVAAWPSGRTRVALGGYGKAPILAMDGPEAVGADVAARDAYLNAGDAWASPAYRSETAATLVRRLVKELQGR